jgi:hypothetical protein
MGCAPLALLEVKLGDALGIGHLIAFGIGGGGIVGEQGFAVLADGGEVAAATEAGQKQSLF